MILAIRQCCSHSHLRVPLADVGPLVPIVLVCARLASFSSPLGIRQACLCVLRVLLVWRVVLHTPGMSILAPGLRRGICTPLLFGCGPYDVCRACDDILDTCATIRGLGGCICLRLRLDLRCPYLPSDSPTQAAPPCTFWLVAKRHTYQAVHRLRRLVRSPPASTSAMRHTLSADKCLPLGVRPGSKATFGVVLSRVPTIVRGDACRCTVVRQRVLAGCCGLLLGRSASSRVLRLRSSGRPCTGQ